MFGTVKPVRCGLSRPNQLAFEQFYCGLCQSLGQHYNQLSRGLHSYDAVFLALLSDALVDAPASPSSCRCPMLPVVHRPTVDPDSPAMRFAAGAQMLLADQFLADRAADGKRAYRAARGLLSGNVAQARALLGEVGVDLDPLTGFELVQHGAEVRGQTSPAEAAEPTARALSLVFEQVVHLPGASHRLRSSASRRKLASLGAAVGRVIYLTDALDDLRKDLLDDEFNPCIAFDGRWVMCERRVGDAEALLRESLAEIHEALHELPIQRHQALLHNILVDGLRRGALEAIHKARGWVSAEGSAVIVAWQQAGLLSRAGQVVLWALAFVMAWVGQLPAALAQTSLKDKLKDKAKEKVGGLLPDAGAPAPTATAKPTASAVVKPDAGVPDAGIPDAGQLPRPSPGGAVRVDAGLPDAGSLDAGSLDAGSAGSGGAHHSNCCNDFCCNPCGDFCCNHEKGCGKAIGDSCDTLLKGFFDAICCIDKCNCPGCNNCGHCGNCGNCHCGRC